VEPSVVILIGLCVVLALAAGLATLAAVTLGQDHKRLEAEARELTAATERLQDRLFAVTESEERYRSLIEAQGDFIVRRADDGAILYANAAYASLLGATPEALVGQALNPAVLSASQGDVRADGARLIDEQIATASGVAWISWAESRVLLPDGAQVTQRVGRDVTARVASEQQRDEALARAKSANDAKSRFLATVSHEFRTPLNGILGMADLLNDTRLDQEQTTYVRALRTSGQALLSLIEEILDFAKVEAGRTTLSEEPFDLVALTEGVVELLAPKAHDKRLSLATYCAPDVPARVIGDPDRVRQILINLVGNAVKFTEAGGVGVRLAMRDGLIAIAVQDTGPGIAPDRIEAIFEEFEQADETTARAHGGSGLGLAIVKRLLPLMGGSIAVESTPGQGATFTVTLALKPVDAQTALPAPDTQGLAVLLVSSAPVEAAVLAELSRDAGARVEVAETPEQAQHWLLKQAFEVALIDLAIGAERARELAILARASGVARRVVVLSPFERRSFGPPSAAGFDAFLVKPVRARSLIAHLRDRGARPAPLAGPEPLPREEAPPGRPRVLLAEDNEINALLARRTLEKLGAEPVWASNGQEALDLLTASLVGEIAPFALGVFDVRMPLMDGLSAARRVREEEAALGAMHRLPLIAITANVAPEDRQAAMAAGFDDCLPKPLVREQLAHWLKLATDTAPAAA
jgi:PAS domain S-box-containing protein